MTFYCDNNRHLVCVPYSVANLHKMAEQLGIKRCWFHAGRRPHYDIPKKRVEEIQAKCVLASSRFVLSVCDGTIKGCPEVERLPEHGTPAKA